VALAVLLAFWTWLYTYDRDRGKFWTGLVIDVVSVALVWTGVGWLGLVGVWIWSIVATTSRPASEYW
jgi:ABC-type glycerol-3-phosphate transport system substrate-binding protein